jgi:hypothetical protein
LRSPTASPRRSPHHYSLPLERFAAAGEVLPLLTGDKTENEVIEGLRCRLSGDALAWAEELLSRLQADGFLERATEIEPNYFLQSAARPRTTFVAHTSLLLQSQATAVLLDPLLRGRLGLSREGLDVTRLELGAICCSHSHGIIATSRPCCCSTSSRGPICSQNWKPG